jgi:hypothetical protein
MAFLHKIIKKWSIVKQTKAIHQAISCLFFLHDAFKGTARNDERSEKRAFGEGIVQIIKFKFEHRGEDINQYKRNSRSHDCKFVSLVAFSLSVLLFRAIYSWLHELIEQLFLSPVALVDELRRFTITTMENLRTK